MAARAIPGEAVNKDRQAWIAANGMEKYRSQHNGGWDNGHRWHARGALYVMTVKGNMPTLYKRLKKRPGADVPATSTVTRDHGRRVRRAVKVAAVPAGASWSEWVRSQLEEGWRSSEWDPGTLLFTGDVTNPMTGAYPCATPSCPTVIHIQNSRCSACRSARRTSGLSQGEFDRTYSPRRGNGRYAQSKDLAIHQFTLAGHSPLVRWEVLYALQCRDLAEICLSPWTVRTLLAKLPTAVPSLLDLDRGETAERLGKSQADLLRGLLAPLDRLHLGLTGADPTEPDVWDCALVGLRSARDRKYPAVFGTLDFRPIGLPWLREIVRAWARDLRPPVTGVGRTIFVAQLASQALSARPHHGDPARLRLADMGVVVEAIMTSGDVGGKPHSHSHRRAHLGWWRRLLDYARAAGLMAKVPDGFTMSGHYRVLPIEQQIEEEPGQAIPDHVLAQMDQYVELLGTPSCYSNGGWAPADFAAMYKTVYQIQRDTGRRNNEVVSLSVDCLQWDDAQPILVYDNHKARRMGRRLPIHRDTATVIQDWQRRRAALPLPAESTQYLFPSPGARNWPSRRHLSTLTYAKKFRAWIIALPPLSDAGLDDDGNERTVDTASIRPYGLRHAYAQRHADGGTDVDVLRELMDHRSIETTMGYYQVSLKHKQEAVRLLAPTAIDRHGQPAGFADEMVYEMSSVAVPFGNCTEPSNVKAGGKHCPIRFQCAGCGFYRPDPSFLPAIDEHIVELRADRELAVTTDAADWVINNLDDQLSAFTTVHDRLRTTWERCRPIPGRPSRTPVGNFARPEPRPSSPSTMYGAARKDADTRTARLLEARRLSAAKKRRDTLKVIDAIVTRGDRITFAGVAREAAVSGWFVRNQPDIRTAIECAIRDQQVAGFPDKRTLGSSTAGLRSDILLAREEVRELRRERDHLRDRLRQRLGAELDHAPRSELVERITELERRTQDLAAEHTEAVTLASRFEAELAAAASDLAAARAANRRLMREANAPKASG